MDSKQCSYSVGRNTVGLGMGTAFQSRAHYSFRCCEMHNLQKYGAKVLTYSMCQKLVHIYLVLCMKNKVCKSFWRMHLFLTVHFTTLDAIVDSRFKSCWGLVIYSWIWGFNCDVMLYKRCTLGFTPGQHVKTTPTFNGYTHCRVTVTCLLIN